jgi:hypothetical protein
MKMFGLLTYPIGMMREHFVAFPLFVISNTTNSNNTTRRLRDWKCFCNCSKLANGLLAYSYLLYCNNKKDKKDTIVQKNIKYRSIEYFYYRFNYINEVCLSMKSDSPLPHAGVAHICSIDNLFYFGSLLDVYSSFRFNKHVYYLLKFQIVIVTIKDIEQDTIIILKEWHSCNQLK